MLGGVLSKFRGEGRAKRAKARAKRAKWSGAGAWGRRSCGVSAGG